MALAFDKEELTSNPVPHLALDHPRLNARVYSTIHVGRQAVRDWRYEPTPWTLRDCVPSTWINRWIYSRTEVTFAGLDRFDRVGLGTKEDVESDYRHVWMNWNSSIGLWRGFGDTLRGPVVDAYVVEHWTRWDVLGKEARIKLLSAAVAYHNREHEFELQHASECASETMARFYRRGARRHAQEARETLQALAALGATIGLDEVNRGRQGQLALF